MKWVNHLLQNCDGRHQIGTAESGLLHRWATFFRDVKAPRTAPFGAATEVVALRQIAAKAQ
jgi:hypothetical protein